MYVVCDVYVRVWVCEGGKGAVSMSECILILAGSPVYPPTSDRHRVVAVLVLFVACRCHCRCGGGEGDAMGGRGAQLAM